MGIPCAHTLYSIFNYRIHFAHEDILVLPVLSKNDTIDRKRTDQGNSTVNCQLCVLRILPDVNCAWLVYIRARKTYDDLAAE